MDNEEVVKYKLIRLSRLLDDNDTRSLFLDSEIPQEKVTDVEIVFWAEESQTPIVVDDLYLEIYQ